MKSEAGGQQHCWCVQLTDSAGLFVGDKLVLAPTALGLSFVTTIMEISQTYNNFHGADPVYTAECRE